MLQIDSQCVGVDQGRVTVFSDVEDGGAMWTGSGPRLVRRSLVFSQPFRAAPAVFVSVEMWDYDSSANIRGDLAASDITETGFDIVFKTWDDTRIARLRAAWMAVGALKSTEDWDV